MQPITTTTARSSKSGFNFVFVDIAVLRDPELTPNEKTVYGIICTHADVKTRITRLAVATIAAEANCSVRTVQNCTKKLAKHGVLACEKRFAENRQVANAYRLIGCDAPCYQRAKQAEIPGEVPVAQEGADSAGSVESCTPKPAQNVEFCTPEDAAAAHRLEPVLNENQKNKPNPSSFTPQAENDRGDERSESEVPIHDTVGQGQTPGQNPDPAPKQDPAFCKDVLTKYHAILPELAQVKKLASSHVREIESRIREDPARAELVWWERYFRSIRDYPYAMGQSPSGWRAYFEWLIGERGMYKVLSGRFIPASTTKGGSERGWELQKRYTDEEGVVDARALLRESE